MTSLTRCRRPDRPLHHVITAKRHSVTRFATWAQGSLATVTCGGCESSRLRTWAGLSKSQRFRGLLLSSAATSAKYSAKCTDRSVPWGKYWRSSPLMFSLDPRRHLVGAVDGAGQGDLGLGHDSGGHTSWHCRTCDAVVYGPPLSKHCTALEGPASVRISTRLGRPKHKIPTPEPPRRQ